MRLLRISYWKCLSERLKPRKISSNHRRLFSATGSGVQNSDSEWQKPDAVDAYDTGITVYNCVHRGNVPFMLRNEQNTYLTWYTCGPTVYDDAHIGHAICYMKCDIIQRILRNHFNLNVITAMNITDIDDKLVARAPILNCSVKELAERYEQSFWQDMDALGIQRADIIVRVTEFIPQIIAFIEKLLAKEDAYVAADGSVYYANRRTNGKLKNLESSTAATTAAAAPDTHTKLDATSISVRRSANDFALWKAAVKPNEPQWNVPWKYDADNSIPTAGRPGWHTECAAMATELFGNTIDVHAGGIDLKFPHHENEEAQCCSYHNRKQWVNYWLHIGHLVTTDNIKMSKSLKNTISIKEFLKHYSRAQLRLACLISTYHQHMEFSDDILLTSGDLLKRYVSFFDDSERFLHHQQKTVRISNRNEILAAIHATRQRIDCALRDDFDTRSCIGSLNDLITLINKSINPQHLKQQTQSNELNGDGDGGSGSGVDVIKYGQNVVRDFLEMVGLHDITNLAFAHQKLTKHAAAGVASPPPPSSASSIPIENLINDLLLCRSKILGDAKSSKDKKLFEICDQLRSIMRQNGLAVKDFDGQSTWTFDNVVTRKNPSKK